MKSPKFPLKKKDLEDVVEPSRLKSRWKTKVRESMRSKAIPDPIEHLDFHVNIDATCKSLSAEISSGTYIPQPPARFLSEKSKGLCRQLVIPAVRDALVLQTLADALWVELSKKAPSKNSFYAPADQAFAKAALLQDDDYESTSIWLQFQKKILGFTKTYPFILVTDIANYYDCISYDHLRNILSDLSIVREHSLDLLIYTLSHMLWQPDYMPRVPVGLPQMNLDAPRLLAHCLLFEIDDLLTKELKVDFARYMDDIDVGVNSIAEAKRTLRDLDLSLQTRQIRLNGGKTNILSAKQAARHFRIRENAFLNAFEKSVSKKIAAGKTINRERRFLTNSLRTGLKRGVFDGGNGSKVLKRLLGYAKSFSCVIDDDVFENILINWPQHRNSVFIWWQHHPQSLAQLCIIDKFLNDPMIVDDGTLISASIALVNARLPASLATQLTLQSICAGLQMDKPWALYAKLWIMSKYSNDEDLFDCVSKSFNTWASHEYLSRLVAGLTPRFKEILLKEKYTNTLRRAGDRWSASVQKFHDEIGNTRAGYTAVYKFVNAPNKSYPNRVTHAKFLMFLSLLTNVSIAPTVLGNIKKVHAFALSDPFYALLVPGAV